MLYDIKCIILALKMYSGGIQGAGVYRSRSFASFGLCLFQSSI